MTTNGFDPGPLGDATATPADGKRWTLVFVRELRHPPEKVWAALTDPDQLDRWAPFRSDRNLGDLGTATLMMIDGDNAEPLQATVHRAEPPNLLEYNWGPDLLRWELRPTDPPGGTRLSLTHTVADHTWLAKVAAGWHLCLEVAARLLDGHPVGVIRGRDAMNYGWLDLHDAYAAKLGLPAE